MQRPPSKEPSVSLREERPLYIGTKITRIIRFIQKHHCIPAPLNTKNLEIYLPGTKIYTFTFNFTFTFTFFITTYLT
ncbi:hypothetical protein GGR56DRAFT_672115 [Xylariaceae sp. FL0804]|nr:hypothetical protein GGR56DRAFT_672115 [Xylariaceae sp. FL0804]